jgi:predicted RNA binding protein YcfA (HicA-like mRNA interferase family)
LGQPRAPARAVRLLVVAKVYSQKSMRKLLEGHGWTMTLGGKHNVKMVKDGEERPITLPMHKGRDYSRALSASILKQAGVS